MVETRHKRAELEFDVYWSKRSVDVAGLIRTAQHAHCSAHLYVYKRMPFFLNSRTRISVGAMPLPSPRWRRVWYLGCYLLTVTWKCSKNYEIWVFVAKSVSWEFTVACCYWWWWWWWWLCCCCCCCHDNINSIRYDNTIIRYDTQRIYSKTGQFSLAHRN